MRALRDELCDEGLELVELRRLILGALRIAELRRVACLARFQQRGGERRALRWSEVARSAGIGVSLASGGSSYSAVTPRTRALHVPRSRSSNHVDLAEMKDGPATFRVARAIVNRRSLRRILS